MATDADLLHGSAPDGLSVSAPPIALETTPVLPQPASPAAALEPDPHAFLRGGGEMGERTRALDWSKSAVGPVAGWPQNLKTAVGICLGSRYPIVIWWGKSALTTFYNDAYIPVLGVTKHPGWLGRSGRECWSEIWHVIDPMLEGVFTTGEATWSEDFLFVLHRNLPREEGYFTFSYSPIREDSGAVGGIFCAVTETTGRVIGERRLRTLRDLGRTAMAAKAADEACEITARTLAANPADIPFALIYLLEADARHARLVSTTCLQSGSAAAPKRIDLSEPADLTETWPLDRVFETGAPELVSDLPNRFPPLPGGPWPESPETALVLPIAAPGQAQPTGFLVAGLSPRRVMDADYRSFFDLIAGHVATAVANARSFDEERRRAEALAEIDRAKTAFFSTISHEFRTPLTLMLGPIEELLGRSDAELSPSAKGQLEAVNRNGLRLLRLVNTLLDFSRIEAGRVRAVYRPTDLAALTADLASGFRAAIERAGLRLVVDCPQLAQPVYVDREMWEKIVLNLLSNAFKFTFEGEISVAIRQAENAAELRVKDSGIGIPAAEIPRLFERFHRVHSARGRTHEGSGIGLAFVQELIKLHGGSIATESVLDEGTTFTISVPLGSAHLPADQIGDDRSRVSTGMGASPYVEEALRWLPDASEGRSEGPIDGESPAASRPLSGPEPEDNRPRVLVADDNADMRQYVVRLLAQAYRVEAVPDGEAALAAARERPPDLVLTDVMMPRLDGYGLLRELRADPRTSGSPVILLSARAGEESRVEGMEAGADDYLVKPFSAREILARVSAHIQISRLRSQASEAVRESNARFEALFNEAPIGIFVVDGELRIRHVNPKARPVFGDIDGLIGSDFVEVIHRLWQQAYADEIVQRFQHTLQTGESYHVPEHIEERLDRKVIEYYEWQIHRLPLPAGQFGVVCYFSDISRHVLARQALAEADRRKDEFLAILAHELRNPLAPLRNGLQVMKLARNDSSVVEQARTMMERQLAQMIRLIDDLLDISRISQGKVTLRKERIDLPNVIRQAVETSRPLIEARGLELAINVPPHRILVEADVTRLTQAISNLLNNAAKYTDEGGRITLSVQRQGRDAVVSVRDTGIGIPRHMLPKLFEMFTQVDRSSERSQGGLGIGLSLVKRLVEMHGGTVEARSEGRGMGSEFIIRLPVLSVAGPQRSDDAEDRVPATARHRILVADDNRDAALTLATMLEMMGNETQTAYDGLEAVEVAARFRPDVVLLDIGMPRLNGHEAAARIRQQPWGHDVVLVALTGWGQDEDKRRSQDAGFNFHLVKPVDPADIEKLLAGLKTETA